MNRLLSDSIAAGSMNCLRNQIVSKLIQWCRPMLNHLLNQIVSCIVADSMVLSNAESFTESNPIDLYCIKQDQTSEEKKATDLALCFKLWFDTHCKIKILK